MDRQSNTREEYSWFYFRDGHIMCECERERERMSNREGNFRKYLKLLKFTRMKIEGRIERGSNGFNLLKNYVS